MRHWLSRVEYDFGRDRDNSSRALAGLALATVLLSLLPIPVVALELLPTYTMHARFLIFYAPLICFLVLGYLVYVRELLARIMFAGLVEEEADPDPYYPEPVAGRGQMLANRLLAGVFTLLPAILLVASLYCVSRYVVRFNDSVGIASGVLASRIPSPLPGDSAAAQPRTTVSGSPVERSPEEALRRLPGLAADPNPLRTYTLTTAMIDDIPYFAELTTLYIGGIACALAAVLLVLLKEYARSALRLSEEEVLGGRMAEESLAPDFEEVGSPGRPGP